MKFREFLSVLVLSASVAGAVAVLVDVAGLTNPENEPTFSIAPISIGNPAVAATLQTRAPDVGLSALATDSVSGGVPALEPIEQIKVPYEKTVRVKSGNTLSGLLTNAGIEQLEAAEIVGAFAEVFNPRKIMAGQDISLQFMASNNETPNIFVGLTYEPTTLDVIRLDRTETGFVAQKQEKTLVTELHQASGVIDDSLYMAGVRAGLPVPVLVELIRAYSWDVDFQRSIRVGDKFAVMYEARHDTDGTAVTYGDILFAELELSGDKLSIYRFTTASGVTDYFDDKGRSAKKALMRTPIDGARLSSGFGKRKHPILGYTKMHKGVDFAAPSGTPIYAAGDGAILFAGWNGGYGKFIEIRHDSEFTTAYAHMKSIASGMQSGKRVRQGQVIGYVGATGLSTGPHLHYEILKNGTQVNPMKVKMPPGQKLTGMDMEAFKKLTADLNQQYARLMNIKLAQSN